MLIVYATRIFAMSTSPAGALTVTVNATGCGFDSHSMKLKKKYFHFFALVWIQSAALRPATRPSIPSEFGGKF